MIITKLIGGLGNQMFQYAVGRHLAIINRTELYLDISDYAQYPDRYYALDCFNIKAQVATEQVLEDFRSYPDKLTALQRLWQYRLLGHRHIEQSEPHFHFSENIIRQYNSSVYLSGYWQTEQYFKAIEATVRQDFRFAKPMNPLTEQAAGQIMGTGAVSIHIRRGDFVTNQTSNQFHGVCDLGYYQQSIDFIANKITSPTFFIFSDEPDWVAENLKIDYPCHLIGHNQGSDSYQDLYLMSLCQHHIIANSSFSWWGAWLNPSPSKLVIAPKFWLNPHSRWFAEMKIDTKDILPKEWIKIDNQI
jgi:hypothetical protein